MYLWAAGYLSGARFDTSNVVVNQLVWMRDWRDFGQVATSLTGLIAYEGCWLGGEIFVSFDKTAVTLVTVQRQSAKLA